MRTFFKILSVVCFIAVPVSLFASDLKVPVPDFKLPTVNGDVTPAQYKGKVVYIDFWASWCMPCKKSFPWLNKMHEKYQSRGLVILAINLDRKKELADAFLQRIPASFTVAYDPEGLAAKDFKVQGMPTSYLVDRQSMVVGSHTGFREKDIAALEQAIVKLLE